MNLDSSRFFAVTSEALKPRWTEVKSTTDGIEESPSRAGLEAVTKERFKQKIRTRAGRGPRVMKRSEPTDLPAIEAVDTSSHPELL